MTTIALACQEQLLPGTNLIQKYALAAALGYEGIELRGRGDLAFARRLPELRRARADGVVMPTVCVEMHHFIGDFDPARVRDAVAQPALPALGDRRARRRRRDDPGRPTACSPAGCRRSSRRAAPDGDRQVLLDALGELGEHARAEGVTLFLEPLNRYEDHMVNRLDEAVALCAARSGCPRSGSSPTPTT